MDADAAAVRHRRYLLRTQGVPAEHVLTADRMYDIAQLDARGYYQEVKHPITGLHRYPGWPFSHHAGARRPPSVPAADAGQHNDEVLRGLGLTDDEINELRARKVIGETALNA